MRFVGDCAVYPTGRGCGCGDSALCFLHEKKYVRPQIEICFMGISQSPTLITFGTLEGNCHRS